MIFAYEEAVDLHNRNCHHAYQPQSEMTLRAYVVAHRLMALDSRIIAARRYAEMLAETSARLHKKSEELDARFEKWKTSGVSPKAA